MKTYIPTAEENAEFAKTSSEIEREYSQEAIADHLDAWDMMRGIKTLTKDNILECHRLLQRRLRPDIAGKLRDCSVMVGGRVCPNPASVPYLFEEWLTKYADASIFEKEADPDGAIRLAHIEFEHMHPFEDGNGRVGRILMNWHMVMNDMPPLIIHPGEEQFEYYSWFKEHNI